MEDIDHSATAPARLTAAAAWSEDGEPVAPSIWLDGYLAAVVLAL